MRHLSTRHSRWLGAGLLVSLLGGAAVVPAFAQSAPIAAPKARAEQRAARHAEHRAEMHTRLHDTLKLSAAQEPAWKSFTESMQPPARPAMDRQSLAGLTAPERADKMLEFSRQHQAVVEKRAKALKDFYAQLSPEQKSAFDAFHAAMPMRTGGHMQGHRGGHGGPGRGGMPL